MRRIEHELSPSNLRVYSGGAGLALGGSLLGVEAVGLVQVLLRFAWFM